MCRMHTLKNILYILCIIYKIEEIKMKIEKSLYINLSSFEHQNSVSEKKQQNILVESFLL